MYHFNKMTLHGYHQSLLKLTCKVEQLEQKIEELLDHSDMTPEELVDLLNDDIDSVKTRLIINKLLLVQEEVEYIVEAVDEGLVVSLQVGSLFRIGSVLTTI